MNLSVIYLVALGLLWGLHFSLIRWASESGVDYSGLLAFIVIADGAILWGICAARRRWPRFTGRMLAFYLFCTLTGYLIPLVIELWVVPDTGAGLLTVVVSFTPVITVGLALLLRTERVSIGRIAIVMIGMAAILPILWEHPINLSDGLGAGLALAFLVPVSYAFYTNVVAKYWPEDLDSWQITAGETLMALLVIMPVYLWQGAASPVMLLEPSIALLVFAFALFSVFEIYFYFELVRLAGAVYVSMSNFIALVSGVGWSILFFGETHSVWIWVSVVVLFGAIHLAARDDVKSQT